MTQEFFGNPSSLHQPGRSANVFLQKCKSQFIALCGATDKSLILTSGGSEANNLVIRSILGNAPKLRLLLAADSHDSAFFARDIFPKQTDRIYPDENGDYAFENIAKQLKSRTRVFSIPHVCNETGKIHPVTEIAEICHRKNVLLHCDGAQAVGHLDIAEAVSAADFYTFSAHKFGGLRGTGGVICGGQLPGAQISGGRQESGLRAGTENVAGLAAAVVALQQAVDDRIEIAGRLRKLSQKLIANLQNASIDFALNSPPDCLPGLLSISFPGLEGTNLVAELDLLGFAVSAGSACHANNTEPSRVLLALGRSEPEARSAIRISMGQNNTADSVEALAQALVEVARRQRALL